jgi:hypothetical protein
MWLDDCGRLAGRAVVCRHGHRADLRHGWRASCWGACCSSACRFPRWRIGLLPRIGLAWSALRAAWQDAGVRNIARLMLPALLGVSVAHISILINTQIASHG